MPCFRTALGEVRQPRKHHTARLLTHFPPAHLQAPPPERKTSRRWGVYNSQKSAKLHLSPQDFEAWKAERGAPAGAETEPSFGLMPTCPAAIVNDGMRAFLAPDRSGEVSPAASAESWSVGLPQTALSPAPLDEIFPTVCRASRGA